MKMSIAVLITSTKVQKITVNYSPLTNLKEPLVKLALKVGIT